MHVKSWSKIHYYFNLKIEKILVTSYTLDWKYLMVKTMISRSLQNNKFKWGLRKGKTTIHNVRMPISFFIYDKNKKRENIRGRRKNEIEDFLRVNKNQITKNIEANESGCWQNIHCTNFIHITFRLPIFYSLVTFGIVSSPSQRLNFA